MIPVVTIDADAFIESVEKVKQEMQRRLENAVRGYSTEIGSILVDKTPYGNPALWYGLYKKRERDYGLEIMPGIAKGSWSWSAGISPLLLQAPVGGTEEGYSDPGGNSPKRRMQEQAKKYKLGERVWITNSAHYIKRLEAGQSKLKNADGILKPSLSKIISIYSVSFIEHYKKG